MSSSKEEYFNKLFKMLLKHHMSRSDIELILLEECELAENVNQLSSMKRSLKESFCKRFSCIICNEIAINPRRSICFENGSICCNRYFCEYCINKWPNTAKSEARQSCPNCLKSNVYAKKCDHVNSIIESVFKIVFQKNDRLNRRRIVEKREKEQEAIFSVDLVDRSKTNSNFEENIESTESTFYEIWSWMEAYFIPILLIILLCLFFMYLRV